MKKIILALSKGRILPETLRVLSQIDIIPVEDIYKSRKLIFPTNNPNIDLAIIRATDVPTYVAYGAADMGIVGKDTLMEHTFDNNWYEVLDLQIAKCKLMTAVPVNPKPVIGTLTVATKFANITRNFYSQKAQAVNVIKLYGALELAPLMGLAHKIVDIVDTGKTLAANNMIADELICHISSRLIVNPVSMKVHHHLINKILNQLQQISINE